MNNSNWATKEDFKKMLQELNIKEGIEKSGIPILYDDNKVYIDTNERHNLIIGSTGSGKTQAIILPILKSSMLAKESFLVHDSKGELYEQTAAELKKKGYKVIALNFHDATLGNSWNPLTVPYKVYKAGNYDKAIELIEDLGYYIFMGEENKNSDPFWINSAINYFSGLVLYLFEYAKEEEINLTSVGALANQLQDKEKSDKVREMISQNNSINIKMIGILNAPPETKGSILSVFNQKMVVYLARKNVENMLSKTDFEIENIMKEPTAIFVTSGIASYGKRLFPLLAKQIIDIIDINKRTEKRINILLDEFGTMGPIKDLPEILAYCRGLNVRFTVCIQSYTHLLNIYTKEELEILKMSFGNTIYLLSEDSYTLEEISSRCGTYTVEKQEVPLISMSELKTLKPFEAIVLTTRMLPLKTNLLPDYKMDWGYTTEKELIPPRKTEEIHIYEFGK